MGCWNLADLKPTFYVTKNAHNQLVSLVTIDVQIVLITPPTVSNVLETELETQNVTVQKEPMILVLKFAQFVTPDVELVNPQPLIVLNVLKEESTHQSVHVHTEVGTTVKSVNHVTTSVLLVLLNTHVLNVLETESTHQNVIVHQEP
jgi:hypothetical protein